MPAALLLFAMAALLLAGCGSGGGEAVSGGTTDREPVETFEVVVKGGAVVGGPQAFKVGAGDVVRISVESDERDELHVHGIDATAQIEADETTDVTVFIDDPGTYEVELHDTGALLGKLEVR
jgi:hypothetical protein